MNPSSSRKRASLVGLLQVLGAQTTLVLAVLVVWEEVPKIEWLRSRYHLLDPFFVSSPTRIAERLATLMTGRGGSVLIWPYVWPTLSASLVGVVVGVTLGGALGLLLSNFQFLSRVLNPFVVAANAVPRIALIPIVVILVGPTFQTSVIICILVVLFVAFFNAFEGGRTVSQHLLDNAALLGASRWQIMSHIRLPYVMAWTLAALPLATTFAVISVVTGELLTGYPGLGRLVSVASESADSTLTFAVVVVLSVLGVCVVGVANLLRRRILHWWG